MTGDQSEAPSDRRKGIQSVETGLRVLQGLVELGGPSTLGTVANAVGMPNSQVHRYLRSLIVAGMAQQDPSTGRYDLGTAVLKLGLGALSRIEPFKVADRGAAEFSARTGRTVQLAALGPLGPTIVRWNVGRPPVLTSFSVGSVLPLLHSATGQVFLTFNPPAETDALLQQELRHARGMGRRDVELLKSTIRAQGFAHVEGTMVPGLRATACPVFDLQGRAIVTATIVDAAAYLRDDEEAVRAGLLEMCARMSEELGWRVAQE